MKLSHLLICAIAVCLLSCRKKEPPKPYYAMDETFKSYFAVGGKGSEYVYMDSANHQYDTVRCVDVDKLSGVDTQPYEGENYQFHYKCSRTVNYSTYLNTYLIKDSSGKDTPQYTYLLNSGTASVGSHVTYESGSFKYSVQEYIPLR